MALPPAVVLLVGCRGAAAAAGSAAAAFAATGIAFLFPFAAGRSLARLECLGAPSEGARVEGGAGRDFTVRLPVLPGALAARFEPGLLVASFVPASGFGTRPAAPFSPELQLDGSDAKVALLGAVAGRALPAEGSSPSGFARIFPRMPFLRRFCFEGSFAGGASGTAPVARVEHAIEARMAAPAPVAPTAPLPPPEGPATPLVAAAAPLNLRFLLFAADLRAFF